MEDKEKQETEEKPKKGKIHGDPVVILE